MTMNKQSEQLLLHLKRGVKYALMLMTILLVLQSCSKYEAGVNDWPQFKKDNFRSGHSELNLNLENLTVQWTHQSSQEPVPAWYGPAKEDAYARSGPLPSMRDYDLAYYPIVVGDRMYYASSADDAIHCIDAKSGSEIWQFTTGAPVRVAPVYKSGFLYFGSDDGHVYCINAKNAKLKWKYSPVPESERMVLNNSRLISFWPIRTGVLIEDDIVYFGASLLPWKKSYFCAINIKNGKAQGDGCYIKEFDNMTMEGAMASTGKMLIQPQGRIAPVFFDKSSGEKNGSLPGTGGCFVLVTPDKHIVHPQTSRYKSIKEYVNEDEPEYMTFKGGKEMVIKGDTSFILTDNSLSAYNRKTKELLWLRRNYQAHRIIMSGDALYVGATDTVYAVSPSNGLPLWKGNVNGTVYALATANNALFASTNEGYIVCFAEGEKHNSLFASNKDKAANIEEKEVLKRETNVVPELTLKSGPFVNAISPDSIQLVFETHNNTSFEINWNTSGLGGVKKYKSTGFRHKVVCPVRKDLIYNYNLKDENGAIATFEYDNFFNYTQVTDVSKVRVKDEKKARLYHDLLGDEHQKGLALILGMNSLIIPEELALYSELNVIAFDEKSDKVQQGRDSWQRHGVYGKRLNAQHIESLRSLPVASEIANVVWINMATSSTLDEVIRLIAPNGIAIVDGASDEWFQKSNLDWQVEVEKKSDGRVILRKLPFEITGDWTHQYGRADNSAYGGESFWGSTQAEDFEIQWMGRPGPRFQTDRSGRKPSPLAVSGRMFVQGNQRVVAVNVYNGQILWSRAFPNFRRMNIHRDCSNWSADNDFIFLAINNNLVKIDQYSGDIVSTISAGASNIDWGYISLNSDYLIGSSIPQGAAYKGFHGGGGDGWYDAVTGSNTNKVLSLDLFAKDKKSGVDMWRYKPKAYIINATITEQDNSIYFVETQNKKLTLKKRGGDEIFKQLALVALDASTGKVKWRKKVKHMPGISMYSMAGGSDKLVVVSSDNWKYMLYTYDMSNGQLLWEKEQKWFHGDHGGHFSRPAIIDNRLIVKPVVYYLNSGEIQDVNLPKVGHGCASYALTDQSVFYRGGSVTQFNFDTHEFSKWERLRPDCWLSTIPAQGMVLSPEAGGGCSCGNWLETSMVMAPVSRAPITITPVVSKPDYKNETYGSYMHAYDPESFIDSINVKIDIKPGVVGKIYYTTNGDKPTDKSLVYGGLINLNKTTNLRVAIYIEKNGRMRRFERNRVFTRLRPKPVVENKRSLAEGKLSVEIINTGVTGAIYYTLDGSEPNLDNGIKGEHFSIDQKTQVNARIIWQENGVVYMSDVVTREVDVPELKTAMQGEYSNGINCDYYEGQWRKLPDFNSLQPQKSRVVKSFDLNMAMKAEGFGLYYSGYLYVPLDGIYTLYTTSDDGSAIYLHGQQLVDNDGAHAAREKANDIALEKGYHPLEVTYYQGGGGKVFSVSIEGPDMEKQSIPEDLIFH